MVRPLETSLVLGTEVKGGPRSIGALEDLLKNRESSSVSPKELSESDSKMSDFIRGSDTTLVSLLGPGGGPLWGVSLLGGNRSSSSELLPSDEPSPTSRVACVCVCVGVRGVGVRVDECWGYVTNVR